MSAFTSMHYTSSCCTWVYLILLLVTNVLFPSFLLQCKVDMPSWALPHVIWYTVYGVTELRRKITASIAITYNFQRFLQNKLRCDFNWNNFFAKRCWYLAIAFISSVFDIMEIYSFIFISSILNIFNRYSEQMNFWQRLLPMLTYFTVN